MLKIQRSYNGDLSLTVLDAVAAASPGAASEVIGHAWRGSLRPVDSFAGWDALPLSLLDVVRLMAVDTRMSPETYATLVESAPEPDQEDLEAIWAAGTMAMRDAEVLRWICANTDRVAESPNWRAVLPGLGGLTVSVPLAEVALRRIIRSRHKLPRELTAFVQLNPWFSPWFSARFRRFNRGRRIRIRDRGATARAWSHARTLLGQRVPFEWSTTHGRGVGRPLDHWSERFLGMYVDLFERTYEGPVPATIASLYAIGKGALEQDEDPQRTAGWDALPHIVEQAGLRMLGQQTTEPDNRGADSLVAASAHFGDRRDLWDEFVHTAYVEGRGLESALTELV